MHGLQSLEPSSNLVAHNRKEFVIHPLFKWTIGFVESSPYQAGYHVSRAVKHLEAIIIPICGWTRSG